MERSLVHFLPVATTMVAAAFATVLWRHARSKPGARYLLWWAIGVTLYGVGTLTEALTTIFGWHEPIFRAWYVAGRPQPPPPDTGQHGDKGFQRG